MSEPLSTSSSSSPAAVSIHDRRRQRWAKAWWSLSLLLLLAGFAETAWQPDVLAALRLIPIWCWPFPGGVALVLARRSQPRILLVTPMLLWLAFVVTAVEETRSLSRSVLSKFSKPAWQEAHGVKLRVVSLNCADGSLRTAREAETLVPDILLFQESPGQIDLERLATDLFGNSQGVLWSPDTSIVARWPMQRSIVRDHFVSGLVQLPEGFQFRVVSLRLAPPVVRYDLWNPACWREQTAKRRQHTKQVNQLWELLIDEIEIDDAIILGGDFNAAQHDRATWRLQDFARDTFDVAGCGWGNTVLNTIPVLRFDQIWAGERCRVIATWAVRSEHSDHRMVVSDLVLQTN